MSSTSASPPVKTIIRPPSGRPTLALGELWRYRAICQVLVRRSIMVRYRQTVVGAAWAMLQPVLMALVFTVFFGLLVKVSSDGIPYAVFFLTGLTVWHVVGKIVAEGSLSIVANSGLVKKTAFPRAYFPMASALGSLVDYAFALVALVALLVYYRIVPGWPIVLLPAFLAIAVSAALGVAFWLSALNVRYRDVAQLLPFITQVWMFSTPIIYSGKIVPAEFHPLYWLNPIVLVVDGLRWAIAGSAAPSLLQWVEAIVVASLMLGSGYLFFRYRQPSFADTV